MLSLVNQINILEELLYFVYVRWLVLKTQTGGSGDVLVIIWD